MISDVDEIILFELLKNGRTNLNSIAKTHNLSKDIVWRRFHKMKKQGIITGSTIGFNYKAFGYEAVANILINAKPEVAQKLIDKMRDIQGIEICRRYNSKYNLVSICLLKSVKDFEALKKLFMQNFELDDFKTLLWLAVKNNPVNILREPQDNSLQDNFYRDSCFSENNKGFIIPDEIDLEIANILINDGRCAFQRISKEVGISIDTVARRYKRLVESGLIKPYIQIDPAKIGFKAIVTFLVSTSSNSKNRENLKEFLGIPRVSYVALLIGNYDFRIVALVKNFEEIFFIEDEIRGIVHVKEMDTAIRKTKAWPVKGQYISTF